MNPDHAARTGAGWAQVLLDSGVSVVPATGHEAAAMRFAEIAVVDVRPNPRQPRRVFDEDDLAELVESIRIVGLLQPIVVTPDPDGAGYLLVAGERRWRAVQALGMDRVPAVIRSTHEGDLLRDALLENLHRAALNPLEEASAYHQLLEDFGCTKEELASRIGRSRPHVSNTIRLLRLPPTVQRRVAAGVLSQGHARALLGLADERAMEVLATRIVAEGLSVRTVEEIVALGGAAADEDPPARRTGRRTGSSAGLESFAEELSDRLDTRVQVTMGRSKGRVTIEFAGVDDLERIVTVLRQGGTAD